MKWVSKAATMQQKYKKGDGIRRDERWMRNQTFRPKKQSQEELMRDWLVKQEGLPPETPTANKTLPVLDLCLFLLLLFAQVALNS